MVNEPENPLFCKTGFCFASTITRLKERNFSETKLLNESVFGIGSLKLESRKGLFLAIIITFFPIMESSTGQKL